MRSVANMVDQLGHDFEFWVVTSDRDALIKSPYTGVALNEWNKVGNANVFYCTRSHQALGSFVKLIRATPHDVVYLNSYFNPVFTMMPLLANRMTGNARKPLVIAPRGEFSPGALALKWRKKAAFTYIARSVGLYRNVTWHASNEMEAEQIRAKLGESQRVLIAPNLSGPVQSISENEIRRDSTSPLRVIFLSRITPKKNLEVVLQSLRAAKVAAQLSIAGVVDDDAYWRKCQGVIANLPEYITVKYIGAVPHDEVHILLAGHDLLFLPTLGENYGHVIIESLAAGTPVLVSDQTPWRDLDNAGVGWVRGVTDVQGYADILRKLAKDDGPDQGERRSRAAAFAAALRQDESALTANRRLFDRYRVATP